MIDSKAGLNERFLAGELLGALGDSRLEEETMVKVPGGEFLRGSKEWDNSQPERRIYLDDFWIGKYPVTNQEFKEFVEAGGYQNREWWSRKVGSGGRKRKFSSRDYWHDRKWNGPNFPVVGVSWYEAEAYIKWLRAEKREKLPAADRGRVGKSRSWN